MNCAAFEERIARYIGGDLPAEESVELQQHLRLCADCADLARALEGDREWLASRPPEAADVDYLAMRRAIRQEIARPRRAWKWKWIAAAAAILLAVGLANLPRGTQLKQVVATTPPKAPDRVLAAAAPKSAPKPRTVAPPPQVALEAGDPSVEIHIATRDPNVTIVLLHESKGVTQ